MNKELEKINDKLQNLYEERQQNTKLGKRIREVNGKLTKLHNQAKKRKSALSKEKKQFERVEKYSTNKLFKTILGDREKQLEKERQEYLQAALEYNSIVDMIELLDYELEVIGGKHQNEEALELKLDKLIVEKENKLKIYDKKASEAIKSYDSKILNQKLLLKEMDEAEQVGKYCMSLLNDTIRNLRKVQNWGYVDSGYGNYAKRSFVEKSRILVANTKVHLDKFSKELSDVYSNLNVEFQLENFNNFINIFFDNLITDWIIQRQIHNALNNISSVKDKVNRLLANLQSDVNTAQATIVKLIEDKKEFIVNL